MEYVFLAKKILVGHTLKRSEHLDDPSSRVDWVERKERIEWVNYHKENLKENLRIGEGDYVRIDNEKLRIEMFERDPFTNTFKCYLDKVLEEVQDPNSISEERAYEMIHRMRNSPKTMWGIIKRALRL